MSEKLMVERFLWFDRQVRAGRYPNATGMAGRWEISHKTAQRTIAFIRDRLGAPLEYDFTRKGYFYSQANYFIPFLQITQEEVLSILVAKNLLSHAAGGIISRSIDKLRRRLFAETGSIGLTEEKMEEAFSAAWNGYSPTQGETFRLVTSALLEHHLLAFTYHSPSTGQTTRRMAEPHHLQHYMGSWILIAWCRLRDDWRKLFLSRMDHLSIMQESFIPRPQSQWRHLLEGAFGIFQGEETIVVTLRFNPFRARWIAEQYWHLDQRITRLPDGGLDLTLPVSDFREIKMKILQFGADVEVIAPEELRQEMQKEIMKMSKIYK